MRQLFYSISLLGIIFLAQACASQKNVEGKASDLFHINYKNWARVGVINDLKERKKIFSIELPKEMEENFFSNCKDEINMSGIIWCFLDPDQADSLVVGHWHNKNNLEKKIFFSFNVFSNEIDKDVILRKKGKEDSILYSNENVGLLHKFRETEFNYGGVRMFTQQVRVYSNSWGMSMNFAETDYPRDDEKRVSYSYYENSALLQKIIKSIIVY